MVPADAGVALVVVLTGLRGVLVGVVREASSLAGVALACVAVRSGSAPLGARLAEVTGLGAGAARIGAAVLLVVASLLAVAVAGRALRRVVRAAGLGSWDRLAGAALGALEGAVLAALLLAGARYALGPHHPWLEGSRSLALYERAEGWVLALRRSPSHVAAPPPGRAPR